MIVAERFLPDRQRFAQQRLGALVGTQILVDASELDERDGDIRVLRTEKLAAHDQRLRQVAFGVGIVRLFDQHGAQIVECLRHANVLRPEYVPAALERLFEQTLRLVVGAEPAIQPAEDREDFGLRFVVAGELTLCLLGAGIEQAREL